MSVGGYGILIIFGAFVLLLILNPNLSCFGRRVKSPFYPLIRKRKMSGRTKKGIGPEDRESAQKKTEDYGFRLD
jgi:hypothetical protein